MRNNGFARRPSWTPIHTTRDGLALTKAFMRITEPGLRRRIVHLVEEIAGDDLS